MTTCRLCANLCLKPCLVPLQIILDQAAHLMDAVALGAVPGGWDAARAGIAQRYRDAGYPEMADFIET